MKKLFLSVIVTLFMGAAFANPKYPNPTEKFNETHKELSKLLNSFPTLEMQEEELLVRVKITLNEKHEIVVLNTSTANNDLNYYIKNTLNYQKIDSDELTVGKSFVFVVRFMR